MYRSIRKLNISPTIKLLKSLLVKFKYPAPGIRLLVKCPRVWKDLRTNVPASGTRKKCVFAGIFFFLNGCNLFTYKTDFKCVLNNQSGVKLGLYKLIVLPRQSKNLEQFNSFHLKRWNTCAESIYCLMPSRPRILSFKRKSFSYECRETNLIWCLIFGER